MALIEKELLETLHKNTELAGALMEQATTLKMNVDLLESDKKKLETEKAELLHIYKSNALLMRQRLLSQWELRVRYAHGMFVAFQAIHKHSNGWLYTIDGDGPFMHENQSKKTLLAEKEWVLIWHEVEKRVRVRYEMFLKQIAAAEERERAAATPAFGAVKMTVDNTDDAFRIGNMVWAAFNTDKDDGQGGIKKDEQGRYVYTWEAAKRIAASIPGWHIPTSQDFEDMRKALCASAVGYQSFRFVNGLNTLFGTFVSLWADTKALSHSRHVWLIDGSNGLKGSYADENSYNHLRLVKDAPDVEKV